MTTRKPGQKRTKIQREYDRQEIAKLRLREYTQLEIATELNVSLSTVKRELVRLQADWQAEARADTKAVKAIELQRLDAVMREAWKGWDRSLRDSQTKTVEEGGAGGKRKAKITTTNSSGDPRYLNAMMTAIERRCRILGIDAPTKVAPTNGEGEDIENGVFVVPAPAASVDDWMAQVNAYKVAKAAEEGETPD